MEMNKSKIKTWFKRNRMVHVGWGSTPRMTVLRNSWKCRDSGRMFRVRFYEGEFVVDVGDGDFDRWANSTECTIPFDRFINVHMQYREVAWKIDSIEDIECYYGLDVEQELADILRHEIDVELSKENPNWKQELDDIAIERLREVVKQVEMGYVRNKI